MFACGKTASVLMLFEAIHIKHETDKPHRKRMLVIVYRFRIFAPYKKSRSENSALWRGRFTPAECDAGLVLQAQARQVSG